MRCLYLQTAAAFCHPACSHMAYLWLLPIPALPEVANSATVCWLQQPGSVDGLLPLGSTAHQVLPCNRQSPHLFAGAMVGGRMMLSIYLTT